MEFVADFHLHSKYSRAVSQQMILPVMAEWASKKGLDIITASDFTHPLWFREIKNQLVEENEGLYKLKNSKKKTLFILSTEIASIYKQGDRLRRIHNLIFSPNFETAEKINSDLRKRGCNLSSDGRPIIGLSSKSLLELVLSIDEKIMLVPCHVWTPHFGIYGSASGFDSLFEAFGDLDQYIYGIETGLSSDPIMNWQVAEIRNRTILSFSDAHSPAKMGREATVFVESKNGMSNDKITYEDIIKAIKKEPKGKLKIGYTIEFYPEEGKYHYSGHRNCGVVRGVKETKKDGETCPVCRQTLTEGVLHRVLQLSMPSLIGNTEEKMGKSGIKWHLDKTKNHPPFVKLVPLNEIIAQAEGSTVGSEKVKNKFDDLCKHFRSEVFVLLKAPIPGIAKFFGEKLAKGIEKVRKGEIVISPGFDGEYGKVKIWNGEVEIGTRENNDKTQLGLEF